MKIRLLLVTLTCALVALPSVQAQAPAAAPKRQFETPLGDNMAKMNDALRTIRAQAADASKNADSAKLAATIKTDLNGNDLSTPIATSQWVFVFVPGLNAAAYAEAPDAEGAALESRSCMSSSPGETLQGPSMIGGIRGGLFGGGAGMKTENVP